MAEYIELPPEFIGLQGRVQWVQKVSDNEYHSSCPACGVDENKHSDSNPSDRFIMWLESRTTGKPFGMCFRGCGYKWTPEKQDVIWTPEEIQVFKQKQTELIERENLRITEYAKTVVMKQALYLRYQDNLQNSTYGNQYLDRRGFNSVEWKKYLGFGVWEDYLCKGHDSNYYSPAITMPIKYLDNIVENIKLRVTEAHNPKDRFRNLYKSKTQHIYLPMKADKIENKVLIIEGEMKSAIVAMRGNIRNDVQVMATQGNGIGSRMLHAIRNCEVVWLCLDPDTFIPNEKGITNIMTNARKIGYDRTRIVICKDKVDDAIIKGFNFLNAFNMAVRPSQLGLKS